MELKLFPALEERIFKTLLIVPYGIETRKIPATGSRVNRLLIVPYGIETSIPLFRLDFLRLPFNRTLWN